MSASKYFTAWSAPNLRRLMEPYAAPSSIRVSEPFDTQEFRDYLVDRKYDRDHPPLPRQYYIGPPRPRLPIRGEGATFIGPERRPGANWRESDFDKAARLGVDLGGLSIGAIGLLGKVRSLHDATKLGKAGVELVKKTKDRLTHAPKTFRDPTEEWVNYGGARIGHNVADDPDFNWFTRDLPEFMNTKDVVRNDGKVIKSPWLPVIDHIKKSEAAQLSAIRSKAQRMLEQRKKWDVDDPVSLEWKFLTAPERHTATIGSRTLNSSAANVGNERTFLAYDAQVGDFGGVVLTKRLGARGLYPSTRRFTRREVDQVARHEAGHYYVPSRREADELISLVDRQSMRPDYRYDLLTNDPNDRTKSFTFANIAESRKRSLDTDYEYFTGSKVLNTDGTSSSSSYPTGAEIRERIGQLKDFIAIRKGVPLNKDFLVTEDDVLYALDHYLDPRLGMLDNNMYSFISGVRPNLSRLTKVMNKYAFGIPAGVVGTAALGGAEANNRKGRFSK